MKHHPFKLAAKSILPFFLIFFIATCGKSPEFPALNGFLRKATEAAGMQDSGERARHIKELNELSASQAIRDELEAFRDHTDKKLEALFKRWREPGGLLMDGAKKGLSEGRREILLDSLPSIQQILTATEQGASTMGTYQSLPLVGRILKISQISE